MQERLNPYGELMETLLMQPARYTKALETYTENMSVVYQSMIGTFFNRIVKKFKHEPADSNIFFDTSYSTVQEAPVPNRAARKSFASKIVFDDTVKTAAMFSHCIDTVLNLIQDEQKFLRAIFMWRDSTEKSIFDRNPIESATRRNDVIEILETSLQHMFSKAVPLLNKVLPEASFAQAIMCSVCLEWWTFNISIKSELCSSLLENCRVTLEVYFFNFITQQLQWINEDIASAFYLLPGFVDKVISLWDTSVFKECSRVGGAKNATDLDSSSPIFAQSVVGKMLVSLVEGLISSLRSSSHKNLESLYFYISVMPERGGSALGDALLCVQTMFDAHMQDYVDSVLYQEFHNFLTFLSDVEALMNEISPSEVLFHKSRSDMKVVLKTVPLNHICGIVDSVDDRIHHFNEVKLYDLAKRMFIIKLVQKYAQFGKFAELCYNHTIEDQVVQLKNYVAKLGVTEKELSQLH